MTTSLLKRREQADTAASVFDFEREDAVATFWRQATPGTAYWRCHLPAKHLPGQSIGFEVTDLQWDEERELVWLPRQRGAAVWQFLGDNTRSRIAYAQKEAGCPTLMELDDDYTRLPKKIPGIAVAAWTKTNAEAIVPGGSGYSIERHVEDVQWVDGIIVSTPRLAEVYSGLNEHVYVCPNSVDPDDWQDIERHTDPVFRIGYYGSPSHIHDFPLVKKALKWASRQKGVEVMFIGFKPPAWSGPVAPWADDMMSARKHLGLLDVGVAPLMATPWASAKSDIKILEYTMGGVLPLMQRAEPFRPWFDRFPELVVDDWETAIRWVVQNRDAAPQMHDRAKQYVLMERTIQANIHKWREAIEDAKARRS